MVNVGVFAVNLLIYLQDYTYAALRPEDLCDLVLALDGRIRYAGVYLNENYTYKLQKNIHQYFSDEENTISVKTEVVRASLRRYMAEKVGEPIYAMTQYPKVKLITMHFMNTNLLLISTEPDANHDDIIRKALELVKKYAPVLE
ncbi:MAG: hypothetical protein KGI25_08030 [Thaumarchaeota archaeon]|nr:hypothetical protein [Nitrososphaerota archaeon]